MPRRASSVLLRHLGEFGFIERVGRRVGRTRPPVIRGMGDDAAVVSLGSGHALLLTVDLLIEDIHFSRATTRMEDVGYKAAVSNFSDIAAMGATPQFALTAVAAPPSTPVKEMDALYAGFLQACRQYGVQLLGGDTSASPRHLFLSVTVTGMATGGRILTRDRASIGDEIYVTGTIGDSCAGLRLIQSSSRHRLPEGAGPKHARFLIRRHVRPTARIREGQFLIRHRLAHAAIDLSDGLSGDLRHLCGQSRVGAEIEAASIPLSPACRWFAGRARQDPVQLALEGGEDYELLVTVPPRERRRLERLARRARVTMTRIGTIRSRRFGIQLRLPSGRLRTLTPSSFQHFSGGSKRGAAVTPS